MIDWFKSNNSLDPPLVAEDDKCFQQLRKKFPKCDEAFLRMCIAGLKDKKTDIELAQAVTAKLTQMVHYPQQAPVSGPKYATLNAILLSLVKIFPNHDPGYIRRLIQGFTHNQAFLTADHLAENEAPFTARRIGRAGSISPADMFRSEEYVSECKRQLYDDFPLLWKTTIKTVMYENNYDYVACYRVLHAMQQAQNSRWLSRLVNVFTWERKPQPNGWKPTHPELLADIQQVTCELRQAMVNQDENLARQIETEDYTQHAQLIECGCCFVPYSISYLQQCNDGHLICTSCITTCARSALYSAPSFTKLTCFNAQETCHAEFSWDILSKCLPADLFSAYQMAVQKAEAVTSGLELVDCPFCNYVEVKEERPLTPSSMMRPVMQLSFSLQDTMLLLLFCLLVMLGAYAFIIPSVLIVVRIVGQSTVPVPANNPRTEAKTCIEFRCRNLSCLRVSCRRCRKEAHTPLHCDELEEVLQSQEGSIEGLRKHVEDAMALALIRVCPRCNLQFNKKDGCNKMVCRCGFIMCYLCRKDIGEEKYNHFCQHFRQIPGSACTQCTKCDLFREEDEEKVALAAGRKAKQQYLLHHPALVEQIRKRKVVLKGILQQL